MKDLTEAFKALSDETRLTMMALLVRQGELCVCDFVQVLGITQSKASRHLRYLLHAGLVQDRRGGVWVHYRVNEEPGRKARSVIEAVRPVLEGLDLVETEGRLNEWLAAKGRESTTCQPRPAT